MIIQKKSLKISKTVMYAFSIVSWHSGVETKCSVYIQPHPTYILCYPYISLRFLVLFISLFLLAAGACLSSSLPSVTEQQKVCLLKLP